MIDFGWMMSIGLMITFATSFLLFPSLLVAIGPLDSDNTEDKPVTATAIFARFTEKHGVSSTTSVQTQRFIKA